MYGDYFTIPYVSNANPNSLAFNLQHRLRKMCGYSFIGEETITSQGKLDEINTHKTSRGKSKVNIILCIIKIYHSKYLEYICSIHDKRSEARRLRCED